MIEKTDLSYEKAVLIGIITKDQNEDKLEEYLDELEFLTYTAGGEVAKRFSQKMDFPNPYEGPSLFGLIPECVYNLKCLEREICVTSDPK